MKHLKHILFFLIALALRGTAQTSISIDDYGDLFDSIQTNKIFADQKHFVDIRPTFKPDFILEKYHAQRSNDSFNLKNFVATNFDTSFVDTTDILKHIDFLWDHLSRSADSLTEQSTLIPLQHPYIVPGGRFREIYYWDSYFTMLGLKQAGKTEMIQHMLDNISDLIHSYGFMPNGNRTYYLSRSQPPFFSLMISLYAECMKDSTIYSKYYDALKKEYDFWMNGKNSIHEHYSGNMRVVKLNNEEFLNRYWDNSNTPRPESYLYDKEVYSKSENDSTIYRNIRAAAESGWDFSSRWFADGKNLTSIQTTHIVPVDLNCLLYNLEIVLSKGCSTNALSAEYLDAAKRRKELLIKYCWNEEKNFFFDYNITKKEQSNIYSLAGLYPLFFNIVDTTSAKKIATVTQNRFLKNGGLTTTLYNTGQQWDAPNGWAPLQWIGYKSFKNYAINDLANDIAQRWINLNAKVYFETSKMMEKYDVVHTDKPGGGGEYKLQDGFGWTNGVFLALWNELHPLP